jgi:hypothetical protein
MLDVEGSLLVLVYIHSILPPSYLCFAISLVISCTLIHLFVFLDTAYKLWPLTPQIYKLDGLHKIFSPFGYDIVKSKTK